MPDPTYRLRFTKHAAQQKAAVDGSDTKRAKKLTKILGQIQTKPTTYPGLNSHKVPMLKGAGPNGEAMWESYVENKTPGAWRVFWYFDSAIRGDIVVTSIEAHS